MISKRQWRRCLAGAKGQTLRESVNGELRSQDSTLNDMGIRSLYVTNIEGSWRVVVNGQYQTGGYDGLSEVLDALARCPIAFDDDVDPEGKSL